MRDNSGICLDLDEYVTRFERLCDEHNSREDIYRLREFEELSYTRD